MRAPILAPKAGDHAVDAELVVGRIGCHRIRLHSHILSVQRGQDSAGHRQIFDVSSSAVGLCGPVQKGLASI
jgi:hypothetical protein